MVTSFDPDGAAVPGSGIFGLPHTSEQADVVLVPVPFDATVSYGAGTAQGPAAILRASHQVDLFDPQIGRPFERGIHMQPARQAIAELAERARALAAPIIAAGGATAAHGETVAEVDALCAEVHGLVRADVSAVLDRGKIPGVVGGDHSVALGAVQAIAGHHGEVGILQVDAHADLRESYEGFRFSHASIMANVLREVPEVVRLVQVGIRDVCESEVQRAQQDARVVQHHDLDWRRRLAGGETLQALLEEAVAALPPAVYVSFDIDGLDPALCPGTGTPVPGGLLFHEAALLLETLARSGRRVVGFDLSEVAPRGTADDWDGNVGARILYKLCGFAMLTA